jgi:hypothetical protein
MTGGHQLLHSEAITWHNLTFKGSSLWDKSWTPRGNASVL